MVRRRAFTLIEILVVIGIVAVLLGVAVVGFGRVMDSQQRSRTKMTLQNTASMFAEYDAATGLRSQPPHMWLPNGTRFTPTSATPMNMWKDTDPADTTPAPGMQGLASPGRVDADQPGRLGLPAVKNTQIVIALSAQMPAAKKILSQIPQDSQIPLPNDATTDWNESAPAIPLDAWGNPIIFVPASGLRGITLDDGAGYVVTSARVYAPTATLPDGELPGTARPFFASAGPDGDFTKGDDNMYSF